MVDTSLHTPKAMWKSKWGYIIFCCKNHWKIQASFNFNSFLLAHMTNCQLGDSNYEKNNNYIFLKLMRESFVAWSVSLAHYSFLSFDYLTSTKTHHFYQNCHLSLSLSLSHQNAYLFLFLSVALFIYLSASFCLSLSVSLSFSLSVCFSLTPCPYPYLPPSAHPSLPPSL